VPSWYAYFSCDFHVKILISRARESGMRNERVVFCTYELPSNLCPSQANSCPARVMRFGF
jgi:hypothetical protein